MALSTLPRLPQQPFTAIKRLMTSDSTNDVTVYTASADGAVIEFINIVTNENVTPPVVTLKMTMGSDTVILGATTLALNQGTNGTTASVNVMSEEAANLFKQYSRRTMLLGANAVLKVSLGASLSATKVLDVSVQGFSYTSP